MGRGQRAGEVVRHFLFEIVVCLCNAPSAKAFLRLLPLISLLSFAAMIPNYAAAQTSPPVAAKTGPANLDPERMLIEAREMIYNKDKDAVTAVGDVQIYYKGRVLEADRVTYDRKTKRVLATGNAKITEADGSVSYGDRFDLTDNFKDGFIDSLRVISKDKTRLTAPRAERISGDVTQLDKATYTACEPCKDHPERPPVWQVRAVRVIHNSKEKMVYFENPTIEVFGIPVLWLPYLAAPDSTVQRKSGFLGPHFINKSALGFGVSLPYFWNLAPNYDLTITPTLLSRQGVLGEVQWRHRLEHGEYDVRLAGISPLRPSDFEAPPLGASDKRFRGSVETNGKFLINPQWSFGWNIAFATDKYFYSDFKVPSEVLTANYFKETTSTLYLNGQSPRAYFDMRGYAFQGLSSTDYQNQLPVVAPVIDYHKTIDLPKDRFGLAAGELALDFNFTSLTREAAAYQSTIKNLDGTRVLDKVNNLYDVCTAYNAAGNKDCILRGMAGSYTRFSAEFDWRKQIIDPIGQVWTPFLYGRVDGAFIDLNKSQSFNILNASGQALSNAAQSNFFKNSQTFVGRATPAIGIDYRFPFVASTSWATHTIEPIAQIIARPNEPGITSMPNEDAQSLVFDDTNLFEWNKFSGYDRSEGGVRVNAGVQYTMAFKQGGFFNMMAGESFQIAGRNSFATYDVANTGANSGLDKKASDYVGRIAFSPSSMVSFIAKGRFDQATFAAKRLDLIANLTTGPVTSSISYGRYAPQPLIGLPNWREGLSLSSKYKFNQNWWVNGSVLFDLARWKVVPTAARFSVAASGLGIGYSDECTTFALNYTNLLQDTGTGTKTRNQTFLLTLNLRTLGDTSVKASTTSTATDGTALP